MNFYKPDIKVIDETVKDNVLDGYFWCADDGGLPKIETNYHVGQIEGDYNSNWNKNTKTWDRTDHYKNGKLDGISKARNTTGGLIISYYENDQQHGSSILLDASGKMIANSGDCKVHGRRSQMKECEGIYLPGYESVMKAYAGGQKAEQTAKDNRVVEEHWKDGKIRTHYRMENGRIEGKKESFFANGNPEITADYVHGEKNGTETEYFEEGQLKRKTVFASGKSTAETIYYQNGKTSSEWTLISQAFPHLTKSVKTYWDNGKPWTQGTQIDEIWDGDYKLFDESGDLISSGRYDHGELSGTWHDVNKLKHTESDSDYVNAHLVEVRTYMNKKMVRQQKYMPDGSIKSDQNF